MNAALPLPYCGAPALPADVALRWNLDPPLLLVLVAAAVLYWRFAGHGRRPQFFLAGWALTVLIFVSPFCALASALFAARSAHHVLLIAVIPLLLVVAMPPGRRAPPPAVLAVLTVLHALTLWAWHAPSAYAAALADARIYWLMQGTLFGTALALWRAALGHGHSLAVTGAMAFTFMQTALLGALIASTGRPLYAFHLTTTEPWGLSALADQQLAGALMWTLGGAPYLAIALSSVYRLTTSRVATA